MKLYEKVFGCTWKKHNRTAQVSTSLSVASMLPHPSMNDTPSHFEQNAVLPHPVHSFHVLIFHFREQINTWRMYGVIAEGFDHSLDHLDTWKPFAFSHTNKCLLATDSLRHLVRWGNTMLPHQVPYRELAATTAPPEQWTHSWGSWGHQSACSHQRLDPCKWPKSTTLARAGTRKELGKWTIPAKSTA